MATVKVAGERIAEARLERDWTQMELARLADISRVTISNVESGALDSLRYDTLATIAWTLKKPISFFFPHKSLVMAEITVPTYRSKSSRLQKDNRITLMRLRRCELVLQCLYEYLKPRFSDVVVSDALESPAKIQLNDIDDIALKQRISWDLGDGCLPNLAVLLENHGVICFAVPLPEKVDSINVTVKRPNLDGATSIVMYNSRLNYFRQRFSLAHELGHIVLHSSIPQEDYAANCALYESQANRFASAFLMPSASFVYSVNGTSLEHLLKLKEAWKVSAAAVARRLLDTNCITDSVYTYLNVQMSQRKWRKVEPNDDLYTPEQPYYMSHAFAYALGNGLVSANAIMEYTGLPVDELVTYVGNRQYFMPAVPVMDFTQR